MAGYFKTGALVCLIQTMTFVVTQLGNFKVMQPSELYWMVQTGTQQDLPAGHVLIQEG